MNYLQREQMEDEMLLNFVKVASRSIEGADDFISDKLNAAEHGTEKMKELQRISNAILRVKQSIETLKFEL